MRHDTGTSVSLSRIVGLLLLLGVIHGCQTGGSRRQAPTQVDRLIQVYPELKSGRMLIIGDFEEPKHMELVHLDAGSERASCVHDPKQGRRETGGGCVVFTAAGPDDAVVIDNANASQWYLKRDWRDYDLLLMSLRAPARGLFAEVTLSGGPAAQRLSTRASIPLDLGWNVLRLDLAEVAERIPLDDVQAIRIGVSGVTTPASLVIDDVLLAGNREDLLGDSAGSTPGLYVQRVGRRWRVGARGTGNDFELAFGSGQIVEWYNLASDPHRVRNLVAGTALGPTPVVVDPATGAPSDFSFLGRAVVAQPRIVEMNAVRVVIESEWRFVDDARAGLGGLDRRPFQRWRYVIYPSGQLYFTVESTAETDSWKGATLGLAVSMSPSSPGAAALRSGILEKDAQSPAAGAFVSVDLTDADAYLLYVPVAEGGGMRIHETPGGPTSGARGRLAIVAAGERPAGDVARWRGHLRVGAGALSEVDAAAQARQYVQGGSLRFEVGAPFESADGNPVAGGFDPNEGCYNVVPDNGRVRFVLDGAVRTAYSPVVRIKDTAGRDTWVYVDNLIFDRVSRDGDGNLIFQLPGRLDKPTRVEVIIKRQPGTG